MFGVGRTITATSSATFSRQTARLVKPCMMPSSGSLSGRAKNLLPPKGTGLRRERGGPLQGRGQGHLHEGDEEERSFGVRVSARGGGRAGGITSQARGNVEVIHSSANTERQNTFVPENLSARGAMREMLDMDLDVSA